MKFLRRIRNERGRRYSKYRQQLRNDFRFRCAYCGTTEGEVPRRGYWEIDHYRPKSSFNSKEKADHYSNLYYACRDCNRAKSDTVPGSTFVDPTKERLIGGLAELDENGVLIHKGNPKARRTIAVCRLNREELIRARRKSRLERAEFFTRVSQLQAQITLIEDSLGSKAASPLQRDLEQLLSRLRMQWRPFDHP